MSTETIKINVIGGMCRLEFQIGCSCGPDPDANPCIGFTQIADVPAIRPRDGKYHSGMGVFTRSDAKRLADAINEFLAREPVSLASTERGKS